GLPSGFGYDSHVGTNSLLQAIPQVQGSQSETVAFRVYALNTTVTQAASPDDTPVAGPTPFSDSTTVAITEVTIDGFGVGETPVTVAIGAVGVWTTIAYGVSAQLQSDGSVIFTGVQEGDQYGIETGTDFNAVAVTSLAAGVGPGAPNNSTTNSFDLGIFSIGQVETGDPINIKLDLQLTDFDGDTIVVTDALDITILPDSTPPVVLDLDGDGVEFLSQDAGVAYDYGNGSVATAWVGPDDGLLVRDANGNGTVDGASEFVFGGNGQTDLQALASQYGSTLDVNDADFAKFGVWQDANSNGAVDAGEFQSLTAQGIASINLVSDGASYSAAGGDVEVAGSSTYTRADGSTGVVADASFLTGRSADEGRALNTSSSNIALAAAIAAAGLMSDAAAAQHAVGDDGNGQNGEQSNFYMPEVVEHLSAADDGDSSSASLLAAEPQAEASAPASSSGSSDDNSSSNQGLDDSSVSAASDASDQTPVANDDGPAPAADSIGPVAPTVAMVSAEALEAAKAGVDANAQHGGAVEQILADALGEGDAPTVDAALANLPGGNGELSALATIASPAEALVSGWDMGGQGAIGTIHDMMLSMHAPGMHHDAVQPAVNG
ncbi:MAG: hypothetical protein ACJ8D3_01080, partial [Sphingomicrobium sp.]